MRKHVFLITIFLGSLALAGCGSTAVNVNVNSNANVAVADAQPAATPASASAESQNLSARSVVAELYKHHDAQKGPFFQSRDRTLIDKYFTKPLADLIWKDATTAGEEVGAIDGDPLYNAQDMDIKNFAVGEAVVKGSAATVPVTFTNFKEKKTLQFAMKFENNAWKIDNISYGGKDSLLKWLKDTYPAGSTAASPADGTFDGQYQVGDTTCVVEPIKMSYEVRWAKGKGVENFFYKTETTFESATDSGNQFVFDDEKYNAGTFYRADGKRFAIKRIR